MYGKKKSCGCLNKRGATGATGRIGATGATGLVGATGASGSAPDVSFNVSKSGTQSIPPSLNAFNYTPITGWDVLGVGEYNNVSFSNITGIFTCPLAGKYHVTANVKCGSSSGTPEVGSIVCLRIFDVTSNLQIAETRSTTDVWTANTGIYLSVSRDVQLCVGEQIRLDFCYLTTNAVPNISIDADLGSTYFCAHLFTTTN